MKKSAGQSSVIKESSEGALGFRRAANFGQAPRRFRN
jgi:hypothetical protein